MLSILCSWGWLFLFRCKKVRLSFIKHCHPEILSLLLWQKNRAPSQRRPYKNTCVFYDSIPSICSFEKKVNTFSKNLPPKSSKQICYNFVNKIKCTCYQLILFEETLFFFYSYIKQLLKFFNSMFFYFFRYNHIIYTQHTDKL